MMFANDVSVRGFYDSVTFRLEIRCTINSSALPYLVHLDTEKGF